MLGVIGGTAEWIFAFADRISVTVQRRRRHRGPATARTLAATSVGRCRQGAATSPAPLPPWQIVKEKRATFAATPEQDAKRPAARTALAQPVPGRRLDRTPACPPPSKARCARAKRRRLWRCGICLYSGVDHEPARSRRVRRSWKARSAPPPTRSCAQQRPDGHWVFELEADATIPAEYVLLVHYLARDAQPGAGAQDRRLSAPHPGRPWRLAAVSRRRLRHLARR